MVRQVFFFFEQLGWCPPGSWCPTQTAYSAYRERQYCLYVRLYVRTQFTQCWSQHGIHRMSYCRGHSRIQSALLLFAVSFLIDTCNYITLCKWVVTTVSCWLQTCFKLAGKQILKAHSYMYNGSNQECCDTSLINALHSIIWKALSRLNEASHPFSITLSAVSHCFAFFHLSVSLLPVLALCYST